MRGGSLNELRPYWSKLCLISIHVHGIWRDLTPRLKCSIHFKSHFQEKIWHFLLRNSGQLLHYPRVGCYFTTPYYPIYTQLSVMWSLKAGVHMKAIFWLVIMVLTQISCSCFKQSRISMLIQHIYVLEIGILKIWCCFEIRI